MGSVHGRYLPGESAVKASSIRNWQAGLLLAGLSSLAGCGREVGRLPFSAEGKEAATMSLQAGEVAFWTDVDLKYEGAAEATYSIELEQAGSSVGKVQCDPLTPDVKLRWMETRFADSRSLSGWGRMRCEARIAKPGPTTVRATLAFTTVPHTLSFRKADLVLKQ